MIRTHAGCYDRIGLFRIVLGNTMLAIEAAQSRSFLQPHQHHKPARSGWNPHRAPLVNELSYGQTLYRLARDLMISEIILGEFRKIGVKVISADGGIDLTLGNDDPSGKLIRQILGAVAEWEKCALVQKLHASRLRMRRAGQRCEGKKTYGHTPEEGKVVDSILSLRKEGKSYVAIADQLNDGGIKPHSGEKWHPTLVQRVLQRAKAKPRVIYP